MLVYVIYNHNDPQNPQIYHDYNSARERFDILINRYLQNKKTAISHNEIIIYNEKNQPVNQIELLTRPSFYYANRLAQS